MTTQGEPTTPAEGLKWATELRNLSKLLRPNRTPVTNEDRKPDYVALVKFQIETAVRREQSYIEDIFDIDNTIIDTLENEWYVRLSEMDKQRYTFKFLVKDT